MSTGRVQSEEEKKEQEKKEQERRREAQSKWSDAEQWFADYYGKNRHIDRLFWERVEGIGSKAEEADMETRQATNAQAYIGQKKESTYRLTDGLFRATVASGLRSRETNRNFFIELQDGVARPRPPLRESEFASHQKLYMEKFNAVYGQIMDFMAVQCGYSALEIDLPDLSPLMSQYDYMRLNALLDLAKARGLEVSFGPKVMEFLRDKPNDYARYKDLMDKVNESAKAGTKTDLLHQYEYQQAARRFGDLERPERDKYKTQLDEEIAKGANDLAKLNAFDKSVDEVTTRLGELQRSLSALSSHIDNYTKEVGEANDEKGLAAVERAERYIEQAEKQRGQLIDAIKAERNHLQDRHAVLMEKNNTEVKGWVIETSEDNQPLKDEAKAAQKARRDAMQGRLEKIEKDGFPKLNDEALKKVQVDKIAELKTKVEEKKKALQANSKPGGP